MKHIKTFLLLLALFCTSESFSQKSNASPELKTFAAKIEKDILVKMKEFKTPAVAMAIIENGELAYINTVGNSGNKEKSITTTHTIFNVGSISKTITAWGVLKLVDQGKIDLDAPVGNYLKRWSLPNSNFDSTKVTTRRLLSHTAGINLRSIPSYISKSDVPELVNELKGGAKHPAVSVVLEPGSAWKYSGGGYIILQLLIEEVSGKPFDSYMQSEILAPLGMNSSGFERPAKDAANPINLNLKIAPTEYFTGKSGAGFYITINDFIKFVIANFPGKQKIISDKTISMAYQAAPGSNNSYGFGYFLENVSGVGFAGHDGANTGWRALFKIIPEKGDGIIFLTNSSYGSAVYDNAVCEWIKWKSKDGIKDCNSHNEFDQVLVDLYSNGLKSAMALYKDMKTKQPDLSFSEGYLSFLGYDLYDKGFPEDALALLELNTSINSADANAFDSLGEIATRLGKKQKAISAYEQVLKLDPNNTKARENLAKLMK